MLGGLITQTKWMVVRSVPSEPRAAGRTPGPCLVSIALISTHFRAYPRFYSEMITMKLPTDSR